MASRRIRRASLFLAATAALALAAYLGGAVTTGYRDARTPAGPDGDDNPDGGAAVPVPV
ncbi:hypothetical protein [Streptomyces alkaliterrae]|uniref:Uncharacterized protein n=1 Tax=Streptomyces alkaliterrae TaxID=2213162 RepID=A0A7W3WLG9_9ACTN|nr:hypothetical protein [Streptomyces alkaliterrae]MBB1254567.1 hypothetical protein [Streptomyces alkaliterrae]MBB1259438.1 hypothetical protein [Streptomyces alkaliterrae]